jgi:uncharacterized protein (DUF1684 family)
LEISKLRSIIDDKDKNAFVTINDVSDVTGGTYKSGRFIDFVLHAKRPNGVERYPSYQTIFHAVKKLAVIP